MRVAGWMRRYRWLLAGGVAGVVVLAVLLGLLPGSGGSSIPPPRARVYTAASACLLTGPAGLTDRQVAPVWAGMEDASLVTRAKVSYLAAQGPATVGNVTPYLGSLELRRCTVILAVGKPETAVVTVGAAAFPGVRFVVVGSGSARANVTAVPSGSPAGVRSSVAGLVEVATR